MTTIRPLEAGDLSAYVALRRESLLEAPLAFGASPEDDFAGSAEVLRDQLSRAPDWVLFGAFDGETLVGAVGLIRERHRKASHKMQVWGMFVTAAHRRRGIAAALLDATIRHARTVPGIAWVHLVVSSAAPEARRLYERAGFRQWGEEPDALRHEGTSASESLMSLRLD